VTVEKKRKTRLVSGGKGLSSVGRETLLLLRKEEDAITPCEEGFFPRTKLPTLEKEGLELLQKGGSSSRPAAHQQR